MSIARDTAKDDGSVVCVVDPADARARAGISRSVAGEADAGSHQHTWAAATLYHLIEVEAKATTEFPDLIGTIAAGAPRETVGPFCLECGDEFTPS